MPTPKKTKTEDSSFFNRAGIVQCTSDARAGRNLTNDMQLPMSPLTIEGDSNVLAGYPPIPKPMFDLALATGVMCEAVEDTMLDTDETPIILKPGNIYRFDSGRMVYIVRVETDNRLYMIDRDGQVAQQVITNPQPDRILDTRMTVGSESQNPELLALMHKDGIFQPHFALAEKTFEGRN